MEWILDLFKTPLQAGEPLIISGFGKLTAWYFVKYAKLRDLALNLKWDPNLTQQEGARQFGAILKEMEDRWSELVKSGTSLPVHTATSSHQGQASGPILGVGG